MTPTHRYTLEPYRGRASRTVCPNCQHRRHTFKQYVDTETGQHLAPHVGKCDRADGCGYHYAPRHYFAETPGARPLNFNAFSRAVPVKPFDTLPRHLVEATTKAYHQNNFIHFLTQCFGERTALRLAGLYQIGTSKHWPNATIFWQIDVNDKLRTGKIMLYNPADGRRVKQPFNHISWVHGLVSSKQLADSSDTVGGKQLTDSNDRVGSGQLADSSDTVGGKQLADSSEESPANCKPATANFHLKQCLFGEHLLHTDPYKTVAIAESEKTAIIASFFYPKYIWLAAGSLEGLSWDKCKMLKDRRVILFPDVNGYHKWRQKARELNLRLPAAKFTVDDTLERVASEEERTRGIDIADRWVEQLSKH